MGFPSLRTPTIPPTTISGLHVLSLAKSPPRTYKAFPDSNVSKRHVGKKLLLRTTGLLAVVSLIGIGSAAESGGSPDVGSTMPSQKASTAQVDTTSSTVTDSPPLSSSSSQSAQSSTSVNTTSSGGGSLSVTVNGQPVDVPQNGSNQQVITSPDGSQTSVSISNSNTTTSNSSNFSANTTSVNGSSFTNVFDQQTNIQQKFGGP